MQEIWKNGVDTTSSIVDLMLSQGNDNLHTN